MTRASLASIQSRIRIAPMIISGARRSVVTLLVVTTRTWLMSVVSRTRRSLVSRRSTLPQESCVIFRYRRTRDR